MTLRSLSTWCMRFGLYCFLPGHSLTAFVLFGSFAFQPATWTTQALDLPGLPPPLRGKCLSALRRICGRWALLPTSLQIPICYNRLGNPLYRGGFADVWKGEYQSRHVAVKVLRVYSTSEIFKITSVSFQGLAKIIRWSAEADSCSGSARRSWYGTHFAIQTCSPFWVSRRIKNNSRWFQNGW